MIKKIIMGAISMLQTALWYGCGQQKAVVPVVHCSRKVTILLYTYLRKKSSDKKINCKTSSVFCLVFLYFPCHFVIIQCLVYLPNTMALNITKAFNMHNFAHIQHDASLKLRRTSVLKIFSCYFVFSCWRGERSKAKTRHFYIFALRVAGRQVERATFNSVC